MSGKEKLLLLAADLEAHRVRVEGEVEAIEDLAPGAGETPDARTLWALAGHLQAFYTGVEAILIRVADVMEGGAPEGPDSHRQLLHQAALDVEGLRPPVITDETRGGLGPYLAFRHFFRHAYGVDLVWAKMEEKVRGVREMHDRVESDVTRFREFLREVAGA